MAVCHREKRVNMSSVVNVYNTVHVYVYAVLEYFLFVNRIGYCNMDVLAIYVLYQILQNVSQCTS